MQKWKFVLFVQRSVEPLHRFSAVSGQMKRRLAGLWLLE